MERNTKIDKLTIAIPGLFWQDVGDIDYLYPKIKLDNLAKILKHAKMSIIPGSYGELIYSLDDIQGDYAQGLVMQEIAKQQIVTQELATQEVAKTEKCSITNNYSAKYSGFLIAEPTHLRLNRDCLQISESELLQLNETECQSIIDSVNAHFNGEIKLHYLTENMWLFCHNLDIGLLDNNQFYPILDIIGEDINDYMPRDSNGILLNKIINEIQMLLYNLSINQQRISNGSLSVNSLWLWNKNINQTLLTSYSKIYANNLTKLISHAKITSARIYSGKISLIPDSINTAFENNSLIIIDNLYYPCCYRDGFSWMDKLQQLDQTLWLALNTQLGQIKELNILIPQKQNTIKLTIKSSYKYKFWQNQQLINLVKESHAL